MCGIAGFLSFGKQFDFANIAKSMGTSLSHRGPDSNGQWVDESIGLGLIHQRLSIMDLSIHGHQPMHSGNERFVLVFNGEIYNHQDIRQQLEASEQINWRGHSDTETLIQAFTTLGVLKTLDALVGMFAIALWDRDTQKLYLARDRMGEKPLYYGFVNGSFVFASELKAIKCYPGFKSEINLDALYQYLAFNYVPKPLSIYQGIFKLKPGHLFEFGIKSEIKEFPYWKLQDVIQSSKKEIITDEKIAIAAVKKSLSDAVKSQSIADVPLGAFLSGGIDSSTIVALMQTESSKPVNTFTIGFHENAFDESHYASKVAKYLGTQHHDILLSARDCQSIIPKMPQIYDEPFADSSQIPTYLVSKMAKQHVTVALSGDGGDELFGGYNRHHLVPNFWSKLRFIPKPLRVIAAKGLMLAPVECYDAFNSLLPASKKISNLSQKVQKFGQRLGAINHAHDLYYSLLINPILAEAFLTKQLHYKKHDLFAQSYNGESIFEDMLFCDSIYYLPDDILTKVDRASMSVSLETRLPFLDHRVIEISWRLHNDMKMKDGKGKWILREILQEYLPGSLINRPKMGFGIPLSHWLKTDLKEWADDLLSPQQLNVHGLFDVNFIQKIWKEHQLGINDWSSNLWNLCMFQAWYRENF